MGREHIGSKSNILFDQLVQVKSELHAIALYRTVSF